MKQVTVAPEVAGRVTQILFEAGQKVKAGDPLVQIYDTPDRADLANFQAQERLAQVNLGRARTLAQKEFGSKQAEDQAQMSLDQAHAGIAKTNAIIVQKLVRAPFAGELGIRQVNLGQYLNPGNPIATLTDLDTHVCRFHPARAGEQPDQGRPADRSRHRRVSGQDLRRQAHHHRAADRSADPRHQARSDDPKSRPCAAPGHVRQCARRCCRHSTTS